MRGSGEDSREEAPQATTEHRVATIYLSQQSNLGAQIFWILIRGSGKDSRAEAPQATTEHRVATI